MRRLTWTVLVLLAIPLLVFGVRSILAKQAEVYAKEAGDQALLLRLAREGLSDLRANVAAAATQEQGYRTDLERAPIAHRALLAAEREALDAQYEALLISEQSLPDRRRYLRELVEARDRRIAERLMAQDDLEAELARVIQQDQRVGQLLEQRQREQQQLREVYDAKLELLETLKSRRDELEAKRAEAEKAYNNARASVPG